MARHSRSGGGRVFFSNASLSLYFVVLLLKLDVARCVELDVLEGGETEGAGASMHEESIDDDGAREHDAQDPRRLVIRHKGGENVLSRLEDLGFVVEDAQEEVAYVVRGGSDSAIDQLRREGIRVAHRPTPLESDHHREQMRTDARKARIQLHEFNHQSHRETQTRAASGKQKQASRQQWRTPTNAKDTSRRKSPMGVPSSKRRAPLTDNATLKERTERNNERRQEAWEATAAARTKSSSSGPFSNKKLPFPLRKPNSPTSGSKRSESTDPYSPKDTLKLKRMPDDLFSDPSDKVPTHLRRASKQ